MVRKSVPVRATTPEPYATLAEYRFPTGSDTVRPSLELFMLVEGSPSQGELGLDQVLFMRPVAGWGRHATPIDGLYLGGSGTHPGPGILGGAGWLAAGRMLGR